MIRHIASRVPWHISHHGKLFGEMSAESFVESKLELSSLPTVMCPIVGGKQLVTALVTKVSCTGGALHVETAGDSLHPIGTIWADLSIL
jgi:hypothetical protein